MTRLRTADGKLDWQRIVDRAIILAGTTAFIVLWLRSLHVIAERHP